MRVQNLHWSGSGATGAGSCAATPSVAGASCGAGCNRCCGCGSCGSCDCGSGGGGTFFLSAAVLRLWHAVHKLCILSKLQLPPSKQTARM